MNFCHFLVIKFIPVVFNVQISIVVTRLGFCSFMNEHSIKLVDLALSAEEPFGKIDLIRILKPFHNFLILIGYGAELEPFQLNHEDRR